MLTLATLLLLAVGCSKKKVQTVDEDMGRTPGMDTDSGMGTETIPSDRTIRTPPLDKTGVDDGDLGSKGELVDIYFDFDSYIVRSDQRDALNRNGQWLISHSDWKVIIEGHCDERGTEEYNLALGDKRANETRKYLQTLGVAGDRMSTISYGEAYPVDPDATERAWAKNRRAHFVLVPPGR